MTAIEKMFGVDFDIWDKDKQGKRGLVCVGRCQLRNVSFTWAQDFALFTSPRGAFIVDSSKSHDDIVVPVADAQIARLDEYVSECEAVYRADAQERGEEVDLKRVNLEGLGND